MVGQDAVIDTIGGKTPYRDTTLQRSVAGAVAASMKVNGVRRLVVISAVGVGDSADQASGSSSTDVAQFCVDQLTSDAHVGRAVTIANS